MIEVYPIGSHVCVVRPEEFLAMVVAVSIRGEGRVSYECVWWDGKTRRCEWLETCEVHSRDTTRQRIGFRVAD